MHREVTQDTHRPAENVFPSLILHRETYDHPNEPYEMDLMLKLMAKYFYKSSIQEERQCMLKENAFVLHVQHEATTTHLC